MRLHDIQFEKLKKHNVVLKWGSHNLHQERYFYSDEKYIYKIWHRKFNAHHLEVSNGKYEIYEFKSNFSKLASIDCGLINHKTCPAFVDLIIDQKNNCRGYLLRKGIPIKSNKEISIEFIHLVWDISIKSGYAHTDFCCSNVIRMGNTLSLIDIDSTPTRLDTFNQTFEKSYGALREHVLPAYKELIFSYFRN